MKGLLYRDFSMIWDAYKKNLLLVILIYGTMAYTMEMEFFMFAIVFLLGMYAVSSLSFDELSKWDAYARTLPVTAGQQVAAKYLVGLAWMGIGLGLGCGLTLAIGLLRGEPLAEYMLPTLAGCCSSLAMVLLYNSVTYPLSYKLGATKARSGVLLFMAGIFLAIWFISKNVLPAGWWSGVFRSLEAGSSGGNTAVLLAVIGFAAVGLVCYLASWATSTLLYKSKEY